MDKYKSKMFEPFNKKGFIEDLRGRLRELEKEEIELIHERDKWIYLNGQMDMLNEIIDKLKWE